MGIVCWVAGDGAEKERITTDCPKQFPQSIPHDSPMDQSQATQFIQGIFCLQSKAAGHHSPPIPILSTELGCAIRQRTPLCPTPPARSMTLIRSWLACMALNSTQEIVLILYILL